ncbi:tetratricopeptide repeat protein [Noviherbaspirillum galbum]|uniref:Tetratricopeptide repeat protein n=1 Tax=Noviherbaspirillum galbum TaxID=2709383 RepID=A0A6B3SUQ9_9BURK|nr:tetratricopeptide repeat protein [Noviherbaspirillum galbum]NEX64533.1 tetratricopeptide repeat protein [Noviherbaspirillum galbum]
MPTPASGSPALDAAFALFQQGAHADALRRLSALPPAQRDTVAALNLAAACAHALGRLDEAEAHWTRALQVDPDHALIHNNLGILYQKTGRPAQAETAFRHALARRPDYSEASFNFGALWQDLKNLDEAEHWYRNAVAIRPAYAQAHNNLGVVLRMRQRWQEARDRFEEATRIAPDFADAHQNLALVLLHLKELDAADRSIMQSLALNPRHAMALVTLGMLRDVQGREEDALAALQQALDVQPALTEAAVNLASLHARRKRLQEAQSVLERALARDPGSAELHANLGAILRLRQQLPEAEAALERALAINPDDTAALYNLGSLLHNARRHGEAATRLRALAARDPGSAEAQRMLALALQHGPRLQEAEAAFQKALELAPDHALIANAYATFLHNTHRHAEAEQRYRAVIEAHPDLPEARWNLGLLLLKLGRFEEGWALAETRYDKTLETVIADAPSFPFPRWNGESLAGKDILVWPEQGAGDEIQFARFVPMLKAAGARRVTLVCKAPLAPLFQSMAGIDHVQTVEEAMAHLARHDCWSFIASLALHLQVRAGAIPAALPYLHATSARMERWRHRLPQGCRVGLVWKGNAGHGNDAFRSLSGLDVLAPLWTVPGVSYVSLQRGMEKEERVELDARLPLLDLGPLIDDFGDTAAIVSQLDLVICVDTSIAHLAGALGKPCWVMLPWRNTDWRWLHGRDDSPWYPGVMRLYRQPPSEDWHAVVRRIRDDLAAWRKPARTSPP